MSVSSSMTKVGSQAAMFKSNKLTAVVNFDRVTGDVLFYRNKKGQFAVTAQLQG